jgi:uncharacterized protein (DUF305 family)
MSGAISRRSLLRTAGAGTIGVAAGMLGVATVHSASHALSQDDPTPVDIGFCADMTIHHVQAMAMCQRVLGRSTGDSVQAAASEVLQTQAIEVGMMRAWLADWGQSTSPPDMVMGWMGMNDGAGMPLAMMPGLASDEEMMALGIAEGLEQGRMWIELMRTHHLGGIDMASAATEMAGAEKVRRIAQVQVAVQAYEVSQYNDLLATEYA